MVEDLKDSSVGESVKAAGAAEQPARSVSPVRYRRLAEVAPRKLGLTIDSSTNGPWIVAVKPSSQLYGVVFPHEIIVGLDDMDTSSLTGAVLTHHMTKTAKYSETITMLGTIPQTRQNAASHQSNSTTSDEGDSSDFKEE